MSHPCTALACAVVGLCALGANAGEPVPAGDAARVAYFETHIRPVLVERCLECHGADADPPGGSLRLDLRAGWEAGGDSGPALAPGEREPGVLMRALRYESSEMPPDGKLPDAVIDRFERWIADGAADPRGGTLEHPEPAAYAAGDPDGWAFSPPELESVPDVRDQSWPRTVADRFLLSKIEAAGLKPAANAEPAAAFRRLHFDLSGLPPDADDFAAWLADPSEARWRAAVDRLLASPRFGQTWGRHWLDVARYADSNGSDFNATWPDAWRYRDYVVDSVNRDVPFDRFVTEQLAGDLLPAETDAQRTRQVVATGFLALGTKMISERDKEKLALDVADDQIDTVGRAVMGLTLGCARCHDHKFDPVPARDYYALAGVFTSTRTLEGEIQEYVSDFPRIPLPEAPAAVAARERHAAAVAALTADLAAARADRDERALGLTGDAVLVDSAEAETVGKWTLSAYTKPFVGDGYLTDGDGGKGEKSITFPATLPAAGEWEARLFYSAGGNRASNVPVTVRTPDGDAAAVVNMREAGEVGGRAAIVGRFAGAAGDAVVVVVSNAEDRRLCVGRRGRVRAGRGGRGRRFLGRRRRRGGGETVGGRTRSRGSRRPAAAPGGVRGDGPADRRSRRRAVTNPGREFQAGRGRAAGVPVRLRRPRVRHPRRQRAAGTGEVGHVAGPPADGPGVREPRVGAPVRPGDRAVCGQLRRARHPADAPGTAGPPRRDVRA